MMSFLRRVQKKLKTFFRAKLQLEERIFCVSMQRNGTTSVGQFMKKLGIPAAGWPEVDKYRWNRLFFDGNYEAIFKSKEFNAFRGFEDGPWGIGEFYKVLFHRFPKAKFILFTRDPDKWFDSMMSLCNRRTIGNTFRHCYYYNRLSEYWANLDSTHTYSRDGEDNLLPLDEVHRAHYKQIYIERNRHLLEFFNSMDPEKTRWIHLQLEQKDKWIHLGHFLGFNVPPETEVHANRS